MKPARARLVGQTGDSVVSRIWRAWLQMLFGRTVLVLSITFLLGVAVILWHIGRLSHLLIETAALRGSAFQSEVLQEFRSLYTSEVVERVWPHDIIATHDYEQREKAIPLPATFTIELGQRLGERQSGFTVRLYSDYPFPWRVESEEGGPKDQFERDALAFLQDYPTKEFYKFEDYEGRLSLRYATADVMRPQCVRCHNDHPDSPKRDWAVGDVRGVLEVIRPLDKVMAQARLGQMQSVVLLLTIVFLGLGGLTIVIGKLRRTSQELEDQVDSRTVELQRSNQELEREISDRKRAESELAKRAAELARSNTDLEQFAYVASHDLQEPLRAVASYTQLLEQRYAGKLDSDADQFIALAVEGATRMKALINDLLAYSRVGRTAKQFAPTDCNRVLQVAISNLRSAIEECVATVTQTDLPTVMADASQLTHLFQNLLSNAIKFRGPQPPQIHVGAERRESVWVFSVRDNGIGIDPEHWDRVFVIFQRLHLRDDYPGTGIGLSICKKIVEGHGGRIWVESEPGKGSVFHFTWPDKS